YDNIVFIERDFIIVKKGNKYGVVDIENREIVPFEYDEIYNWSSSKCNSISRQFFRKGSKKGLMDEKGNILSEFNYDKIYHSDGCFFNTTINNKSGLLDINGKTIL